MSTTSGSTSSSVPRPPMRRGPGGGGPFGSMGMPAEKSKTFGPSARRLLGRLRPYQEKGVSWLRFLLSRGLGTCLADDMGLGKTVQVLAALLHARAERAGATPAPALLVLPASLLGNWRSEAERFAPTLRLFAAHPSETDAERLAAAARSITPCCSWPNGTQLA